MLGACRHANIRPAVSFHVLRHTHGSMLAMHAVPMGVIPEQLGHADTRMTEKHYAHLAPSYVGDTIRAHFPTLGGGRHQRHHLEAEKAQRCSKLKAAERRQHLQKSL
jgi:hypothetical protein